MFTCRRAREVITLFAIKRNVIVWSRAAGLVAALISEMDVILPPSVWEQVTLRFVIFLVAL